MSRQPFRILVIGAGVIGSVYAVRLQAVGYSVTLLARGPHAGDVRTHGLTLVDAATGQSRTSYVRVVQRLAPDDRYDLALVCVRLDQVATTLPTLSANRHIPLVVFLLNNPTGTTVLMEHLGAERVVLGFSGIGGTREETQMRYVRLRQQPTMPGQVDGQITSRLRQLAAMLERAGFPTTLSHSMDGWLKTHAVFVSCISAALAPEGGDSVQLGQNRARVALMVNATREGVAALQSLGVRVTPFNLPLLFRWMPRWFATRYWQHALQTEVGTLAIAPYANAARAEMSRVAGEILEPSPVPVPTLQRLLAALRDTALATES